jgi:hypothetical protein
MIRNTRKIWLQRILVAVTLDLSPKAGAISAVPAPSNQSENLAIVV